MITKPIVGTLPPWADTGDITQPSDADISTGFPHTDDKPTRQVMNWALNYTTNGVLYLTKRGIPDWGNQTSYTAGDVVRASNNKFYSAVLSNINADPISSPADWQMLYVFPSDLDAIFESDADAMAAHQHLQAQIDEISIITGAGYFAGYGIRIETITRDENYIINDLPHIQSDWNATTPATGQILNQPPISVVGGGPAATSPFTVYSADKSSHLTITVANSGHPTLDSSSSYLICTPTFLANGVIQAMNSILAYSPDGSRHLSISAVNTGHPTLASTTALIVVTSAVQVNSTLSATGFGCRPGGGALKGNVFNIDWTGSADLWIDNTRQGAIVVARASDLAIIAPGAVEAASFNVRASGGGSSYMQFCNNGQFGDGHPWIWSGTGYVIVQSSILYVRGATFQTNGGSNLLYSPDVGSHLNINIASGGGHPTLTSSTGWLLTPSVLQVNNTIQCNNILQSIGTNLYIRASAGAVYFDSNVVVFTVDCQTTVRYVAYSPDQTRYLTIGTANGGHPTLYSSTGQIDVSPLGNVIANGTLTVYGFATISGMTCNGNISAYGFNCRNGHNGTTAGTTFNFYWDGRVQVWIDVTNLGYMAIVDAANSLNLGGGTLTCGALNASGNISFSQILTAAGGASFYIRATAGNIYMDQNNVVMTYNLNVGSLNTGPIVCTTVNCQGNRLDCGPLYPSGGIDSAGGVTCRSTLYVASTCDLGPVSARGGITAGTAGGAGIISTTDHFQSTQPGRFGELYQLYNEHMHIGSTSGTIVANQPISQPSDYRLKKNIEQLDAALPLIMRLHPVWFNYRDDLEYPFTFDGKRHVGFLAHELQAVLPGCVDGDKDAVNEGDTIRPQYAQLQDVIAVLVKAVQELSDKIDGIVPQLN